MEKQIFEAKGPRPKHLTIGRIGLYCFIAEGLQCCAGLVPKRFSNVSRQGIKYLDPADNIVYCITSTGGSNRQSRIAEGKAYLEMEVWYSEAGRNMDSLPYMNVQEIHTYYLTF